MKFWKRLRWIASAVFVALLLLAALGAEPPGQPGGKDNDPARPAPSFNH